MMTIPRTLLGSYTNGDIWLVGSGHQDVGEDIYIRATSNPFAPAGASMDCSFDRLFVTITYSAEVQLVCTPIVDEVYMTAAAFEIHLPRPPNRRSYVFEQPLLQKAESGGYMEGLQGRWFQLQIESAMLDEDENGNVTVMRRGLHPGDLILDEITLKWEEQSPTVRAALAASGGG